MTIWIPSRTTPNMPIQWLSFNRFPLQSNNYQSNCICQVPTIFITLPPLCCSTKSFWTLKSIYQLIHLSKMLLMFSIKLLSLFSNTSHNLLLHIAQDFTFIHSLHIIIVMPCSYFHFYLLHIIFYISFHIKFISIHSYMNGNVNEGRKKFIELFQSCNREV